MAKEAGTAALDDAGDLLRGRGAGPRRLLLPGLDRRAARGLRTRPDRRPRLQRQQQLRHGLDRADARPAVRRGRHQRLRAGARLREDDSAARSAAEPTAGDFKTSPVARHYGIMAAEARLRDVPAHRPDLRRRGPRAHGAVRHDRGRSSPPSAPRTTGTPRTTRTPSSRTRTPSTRSSPRRPSTRRSPSSSAHPPRTARRRPSSCRSGSSNATAWPTRPWRSPRRP